MAAIHVDSYDAWACQGHQAYLRKAFARAAVKRHLTWHRRGDDPCGKCAAGWALRVWRCDALGGTHYHTGHSPRGGEG